jgi:hypothetical protein
MGEIRRQLYLWILVLAFSSSLVAQQSTNQKAIEIKGLVVAEARGPMALVACYHVCGLSLVVKLDKLVPVQYVIVQVEYMGVSSLPGNGLPLQLVEKASRWKFEGILEASESTPLQRYINFADTNGNNVSKDTAIVAWGLLKGAENETLPFGESIRTYRVAVGKYKKIR